MRTMRHRAALIIAILVAGAASAQPLTPGDHTRSLVVGGHAHLLVHVPPPTRTTGSRSSSTSMAGLRPRRSSARSRASSRCPTRAASSSPGPGRGERLERGRMLHQHADRRRVHPRARRDLQIEANIDAARSMRPASRTAARWPTASPARRRICSRPLRRSPSRSAGSAVELVPSRPIPVLTFMGLTDALIPYNGGTWPSAAATFEHWRSTNGCGTGTPEIHTAQGQSYCDYDTSCADGLRVGLCSITAQAFPCQFSTATSCT